jgi:hypothetical protein
MTALGAYYETINVTEKKKTLQGACGKAAKPPVQAG